MSREALVLLVCCCDFRDGAERLISSKSLRNAVIRAFPGLFRILRMCAPRRAAAVVRPRGREKSADRRRRILISRLLIIRASVPRRKSPFPAYFKGFPAVSPLIPPYPAFLKYPVSPQENIITLVLVASLALFIIFGIPKVDFASTFTSADGGFFHGGFTGFVSALAVMCFACQGTTMAPVSMAAVTKNPKRTIPLGIIIITLLLAVIYGAMGIVAGGVLPYAETAGQNISVTARAIFPNALYVFFVVGGGIGAIASSALGGLGMFRYPLLQVANDGWLPSVFKKTDKNGYPYAIYLLFYVISVFPIVTGRSLDAIVSQVMIPAMLINIYMNLACLTLPKKYPEQWAQRSIKMPLWFYNICCVLGAFCAGVVAYNLFKDLTFNDAVFAVVIVVVLCALSILRLKQGAVKAEDLAAKKEEIVRQAIADTTADEAKAA